MVTMEKHTLTAGERKLFGRKVKNLRKEGSLPGNVYGKKIKSQAVVVSIKDFLKVFEEVGETGLVELVIGKDTKPVLVHNLQIDPVDGLPLHVDFLQVDLTQKVTAEVPVETVGECPVEKQGLGTAVLVISEIEVEALPADLPERFQIDVSTLTEVDQTVYVKDIKVDASKVEIKNNPEDVVVKVEAQKEEKEEAPVEQPVEGEAVPAEGESQEGGTVSQEETPKEE